jgi:hypothetical protein
VIPLLDAGGDQGAPAVGTAGRPLSTSNAVAALAG